MNKKIFSVLLVFVFLFVALPAFCEGTGEVAGGTSTTVEPASVDPVSTAAPVEISDEVTAISTTSASGSKVLATVNLIKPVEITQDDVDNIINAYIENGIDMSQVSDNDVLGLLVENELLLQAYQKAGFLDSNGSLTEETANGVLNYYVYILEQQGYSFEDEDSFYSFVETNNIDLQQVLMDYQYTYLKLLYLNTYYSDILNDYSAPTDDEINEFYEVNKDVFENSEKIQLSHVFFAFDDSLTKEEVKAKAEDVLSQINDGSITFEKAVKLYSEDSNTNQNAGLLGWMEYEESEFEQASVRPSKYNSEYRRSIFGDETFEKIFSLDDGEISSVMESTQGYHIFKCLMRMDPKKLGINDAVYPDYSETVYDFINYTLYVNAIQNASYEAENKMYTDLISSNTITYGK